MKNFDLLRHEAILYYKYKLGNEEDRGDSQRIILFYLFIFNTGT